MNIALIGDNGLANLKLFNTYFERINIDQLEVRVILIELDEPSVKNNQTNADHSDNDYADIPDFKQNDNVFIYHPSDIVISQREWREFATLAAESCATFHFIKDRIAFKGQNILKHRFARWGIGQQFSKYRISQ